MSKMKLDWHRECLKNRMEHYSRERQLAIATLAKCDVEDSKNAFQAAQIAEAERMGLDSFDRERFMKPKSK